MSDFMDLAIIKQHLRVKHSRDDAYIELLTKAALRSVLNFIDHGSWDVLKSTNNDEIPEDLQCAVLLIIEDMYSNRAAQQEVNLYINRACERLMFPYRKMGV